MRVFQNYLLALLRRFLLRSVLCSSCKLEALLINYFFRFFLNFDCCAQVTHGHKTK